MKNLFTLCLVLEILGSSGNAKEKATCIGKPVAGFLNPPFGVVMKTGDHVLLYNYYYSNGKICRQAVRYDKKGIITDFLDTKDCGRSYKVSESFQKSSQIDQPYSDQVLAQLEKGQGLEERNPAQIP